MTNQERAEYIIKWMRVGPLTIHPEEVRFIAAQLDEAQREANFQTCQYKHRSERFCSMLIKIRQEVLERNYGEWGKNLLIILKELDGLTTIESPSDKYAKGFRSAREANLSKSAEEWKNDE